MSSLFVALEGINGSGKSTQCALLLDWFKKQGKQASLVREPGGTSLSEQLRPILKYPKTPIHSSTQIALFQAARTQLVEEIIRPSLLRNEIIITDRWLPSTIVYQCLAFTPDTAPDRIRPWSIIQIHKILTRDLEPDLLFFLHVPSEVALERRSKMQSDQPDQFEQQGLALQQRLADSYRRVSNMYGDRAIDLDGDQPVDHVLSQITSHIKL